MWLCSNEMRGFFCRWIMHLSHQQTWGLITACSSGTFVCPRFSKNTKRSSMLTVFSMRTVLRYFWIDYNLFSFIFLQSTLFKTGIYMNEAGTNCLSKGAFHCENWLARPNSCHSDRRGAAGGGGLLKWVAQNSKIWSPFWTSFLFFLHLDAAWAVCGRVGKLL